MYIFLAYSLAEQEQIDQALNINNEVFQLGPSDARYFMEAYFQRGDFLMRKKHYDRARSFFEKGITIAAKLGLRTELSRTLADLREALEDDAEMRQGGKDVLRLLEGSVAHVQSNPLYDKPSACELESPSSMGNERGIPNNF